MSHAKRNHEAFLEPYESAGKRVNNKGYYVNDSYARIAVSLLESEAFQSLSSRQKLLLINMRAQRYGSRPPDKDFKEDDPHWDTVHDRNAFYYPFSLAAKRMPEYRNNSSRFFHDIDDLVGKGFIDIAIHGHNTRSKNVYKYSSRWWQNLKG